MMKNQFLFSSIRRATTANGMGRAVARVGAAMSTTPWLSSSPLSSASSSSLAWDPRLTSMYQQQALDPRFNLFCRPMLPAPTAAAAAAENNHDTMKPTAQDILSTMASVVEHCPHEQPMEEAIKTTDEESAAVVVVVSKFKGLTAKECRRRDQRRKLFHKRRRYFSVLIGRSAREMQRRIVQRQYRDGPMAELLTAGYQKYLANKLYQQNKDSLVQLLVQMRQ